MVLIDGGSSLNIIYLNTLLDMGITRDILIPSTAPFYGITGYSISR